MGKIISFLLRFIPRKYLQLFSHIPLKVYTFFLKGNTVECPVCNSKLSKFMPYGRLISRPNALCPNCLSLERHRLMALYMKQRTNFYTAKHLKVLHVAPEYCFIDRFEEMKNLDYITADIESPLAKVKMDIHEIPFEANTFDVAICNHVMEHVDDYHKAMSELYRVLKPNGAILLYDFRVDNPANPAVHRVTRAMIRGYFPGSELRCRSLTVLPPLSRRLGKLTRVLYPALTRVPLLHTHLLCLLRKPTSRLA